MRPFGRRNDLDDSVKSAECWFFGLPLENLMSNLQSSYMINLAPHHVTCIIGSLVVLKDLAQLMFSHPMFGRLKSIAFLLPTNDAAEVNG